jgi:hypothetical protein
MTDDENAAIEREIDAQLEAELEARKAKMRADIVVRRPRQAALAHLDKINARHPSQELLAGLTVAQETERQRVMDERSRITREKMDRANAAPVAGQVVRGLRPKRVDAAGGSSSFQIKS